ncbi:MAG: hypothetical protein KF725_00500 [Cyclobacteriaceae bacterium]|nr:hypothetical protein [Cyclobacteriaceae bacterium]UYN87056.1 MAG: hypothetical protein KIT51_01905 [Cyclobacteriaceae bacterium]
MDEAGVKKEIAQKINRINDVRILESLDSIVDDLLAKSLGKDFWDDLPEALKSGIQKAEKDLTDGKGLPHQDVMAEIKEKYGR